MSSQWGRSLMRIVRFYSRITLLRQSRPSRNPEIVVSALGQDPRWLARYIVVMDAAPGLRR